MTKFLHLLRSVSLGALLLGSVTAMAEDGSIAIAISDITTTDARVTITPSSNDLSYIWNFMDKETFEEKGGADAIIQDNIDGWQKYANQYAGYKWQDFMIDNLVYSATSGSIASYFSDQLLYDTDYVVYAYGMNTDGTPTTGVFTQEFKTLPTTQSDITFEITLKSVEKSGEYMKALANVVPSNSNERYMVRFFNKKNVERYNISTALGEKRFITDAMLYGYDDEDIATGTNNFTFDYCLPDAEYYIMAIGLNDDNTPSTPLTKAEFTAVVVEALIQGTIELEVSDVTPMNAHIRIVPSDEEMRYYFGITRPEIIENKGGVDNIPEKLIIDWWKFLADLYGSEYVWQDFIPYQTTTGVIDDTVEHLVEIGELEDLMWDTDWALYAVGFDLDGNVITAPAVVYFKTPPTEPSELEFEYEVIGLEYNATASTEKIPAYDVTVEIWPSNDDESYRVNYMEMRFYDQYFDDSVPDLDDFLKRQFMPGAVQFNGPVRLTMPQVKEYDYYGLPIDWGVFSVGWNEGPTTEISVYTFNIEKLLSGISEAAENTVKVRVNGNVLSIEGEYAEAAVYTLDGRIAGGLLPGHSISLSEGVYVVKYTTLEGKTITHKFIVR